MRTVCKNCGGDHPKWECKRPATKSVSRMDGIASSDDLPKAESEARVGSGRSRSTNTADAVKEPVITAGPSAPDTGDAGNHPVTRGPGVENGAPDTNSPQGSEGLSEDGREVTLQRPAEITIQKPKRGRPPTGFDKKAYDRAFMVKKRARLKLERENG